MNIVFHHEHLVFAKGFHDESRKRRICFNHCLLYFPLSHTLSRKLKYKILLFVLLELDAHKGTQHVCTIIYFSLYEIFFFTLIRHVDLVFPPCERLISDP